MTLSDTLRVAIRALRKNKMCALLTILGVVIGIAAVTTIVSIGQGMSGSIQGQFETMGSNMIMVEPANRNRGGVSRNEMPSLTADDCEAIRTLCPSVKGASPMVGFGGQVVFGGSNWKPRDMMGVGQDYLEVRNWELAAGTFFGDREVEAAAKVCVIGHTLVSKLFQTGNPLGETIRISKVPFQVIGVLKEKGAASMGGDQDNVILLPYTTVVRRMYGSKFRNIHMIMASANSREESQAAESEIEKLIMERHDIDSKDDADFNVQSMAEMAESMEMVTGILTMFLAFIAGISLLVGGIGIMNIMLVSVTERTREIGIRMAIGARGRDIMRQFLIESVVLSCIGGAIGLALGVAASTTAAVVINQMNESANLPIVVSLPAAALAMGFAAAVGIFFGFYPARRASKLDPIDALRYE